MKVLILGGKGFIGANLVEYCRTVGMETVSVDRDDYDHKKGENCDVLINAAGNSAKYLAAADPRRDFALSVTPLLDSFSDFHCRHYVFISSVDVYPDHSEPATSREDATIDPSMVSHYGLHKLLGETLVRHYSSCWLIIRLGGILGPGLKKNPVYDLLHDQPLRVSEESRYQYVNAEFLGRAILSVIASDRLREIFNLCGQGTVALKEIRSWLNKPLAYAQEDVPREVYEINNQKLAGIISVPESWKAARQFILTELNQPQRRGEGKNS